MALDVDIECAVIGAGVVGLAVARALARRGREVVVLEAEDGIGRGVSSRNSEVIHAGLYYPTGSLKARCCVAGRAALYAFCAAHGVPHRRCGKIVVATSADQGERLHAIAGRAAANGVSDLQPLSRADLGRLEPALTGERGLLSPSTGIVDSHALMLALQGDLEAHGGRVAVATPVVGGRADADAIRLSTGGSDPTTISARFVVLSAGLASAVLARGIAGVAAASIPRLRYAKGSYFSLARRPPFTRLVYPLPEPGGIGVHLTLDLAGRARFGPDVEWLATEDPGAIDYRVDPGRTPRFRAAIRRYWPDLRDDDLVADYAGVRPKVVGAGEPDGDFILQGSEAHGVRGLVALYGIESPGLTSSLAIADAVAGAIG